MITQFHIIFVYPTNLTVLSNITQEIVYSRNFDSIIIRNSCFDLYGKQVLILGQRDQIEVSLLENEDRDAWKQYLKKGHIQRALENCQTSQKPYVAGIYADQLFLKKQYKDAANFYAQSSKTFEEVTLRFIQENLFTFLIDYLTKVLEIVMKKQDQEQVKPQKNLLCTWIVELKLNEINDILSSK
jgi:hypothetical protein